MTRLRIPRVLLLLGLAYLAITASSAAAIDPSAIARAVDVATAVAAGLLFVERVIALRSRP